MGLFEGIVGLAILGFVVGGLARFAVPGPDPLPIWATIALGVVGTFAGGFVGGLVAALAGADLDDTETAGGVGLVSALLGATVLLVLYRRVVQKRPITGPEAQRTPLRPRGLNRIARKRPHRFLDETEAARDDGLAIDQLQKLVALRDAGKIDPEEYERRKAALVEKL